MDTLTVLIGGMVLTYSGLNFWESNRYGGLFETAFAAVLTFGGMGLFAVSLVKALVGML